MSNLIRNIHKYSWFAFFVIVFLLYLPSLFAGFSYLDDNALILDNLHFLRSPANIINAFKTDVFFAASSAPAYYRPMFTVSLMFDSLISGESPFLYHLTNVIIHAANTSLLFVFLKLLGYKKTKSFFRFTSFCHSSSSSSGSFLDSWEKRHTNVYFFH
jgi:hypothetical protein